jgi:hypothetical protein
MNRHLQRLNTAISTATEGMTTQQLAHHPPGKWSAAQVLEHLALTYSGSTRGFIKCVEAGRPLASPLKLKQRFGTLVVVGLGYLPSGREAPVNTRPKGALGIEMLSQIGSLIVEMDEMIASCQNRFGKHTLLLDHPILGPLTADQWCKFHWVHGRHHVKQIWNLRKGM